MGTGEISAHELMQSLASLYVSVILCFFFFLFIEKHLYFARGPAGLLSDNRWVYTNLEH